jgi:hypothetical protein
MEVRRFSLLVMLLTLAALAAPAPATALPLRAAFYYPWFPEAWSQGAFYPYTHYTPELGFYDSGAIATIRRHLGWFARGDIDAGISSWWGQGTRTDQRLSTLLSTTDAAGSPVKWTIYYRPEGTSNPTVSQISSDLSYLLPRTRDPAWLKVNGKPVIFVYGGVETCDMANRWRQANAGRYYLNLKVFPGYRNCASQPDSWHQYAPSVREDRQAGYSYSVSPGFWKAGELMPRLVRDPWAFDAAIGRQVAAGDPWQLITTFNEWGEGSAVEAAREWVYYACRIACTGVYINRLSDHPLGFASTDPVIAAAGDIAAHCAAGSPPPDAAATAKLLAGAGAVLPLGDNQYEDGAITDYNNCYEPTWGKRKASSKPTPGNHEYHIAGAAGYFQYFNNLPANYCYAWDTWRLCSLDSNNVATANLFLRSQTATFAKCTLAYWHHPRWSSGTQHGSDSGVAPFWTTLYGAHADVVLNGHEHNYERFAKQNPLGQADPNGIREFVVGTGGRSHYQFGTPIANSEFRDSTHFGVLKLTLHPGQYDWQFVATGGAVIDSGSDACH